MSLQTLLISVLVTCVTVGATFFYFRNRMQRTEQKVDLMFSLIQEHENNAKLRQQFQPAAVMQAGMSNNIPQEQFQNVQTSENELINISERISMVLQTAFKRSKTRKGSPPSILKNAIPLSCNFLTVSVTYSISMSLPLSYF